MMIQLYIYRKSDGTFLYEDTGSLEGVLHDIGEDLDFTMTRYPTDGNTYRWVDDKWVLKEDA